MTTGPVIFGSSSVRVAPFAGRLSVQVKLARLFLTARMERGPVNRAVICKDLEEFKRTFGDGIGTTANNSTLQLLKDYTIEVSAGTRPLSDIVVLRLYEGDIDAGKAVETVGGTTPKLKLRAANPGTWGNNLKRKVWQTSAGVYTVQVKEVINGRSKPVRTATGITVNADGVTRFNALMAGVAELVYTSAGTVDWLNIATNAQDDTWVTLANGADSNAITDETLIGGIDEATQERSGLKALAQSYLGGGVLLAPGLGTDSQREIFASHAQEMGRMLVCGPETDLLPPDAKTDYDTAKGMNGAEYAAYFYPRLREFEGLIPKTRSNLGAVAGMLVRCVMQTPGFVAPPSGTLLSAKDVQRAPNGYDLLVHDQNLASLKDYGLNVLYPSGANVTVEGEKLLIPDPANPVTDKIHERLILNTLIYDIGPALMSLGKFYYDAKGFAEQKVRSLIREKVLPYYRSGNLYGNTPDEAYSVTIDEVTTVDGDVGETTVLPVRLRVKTSEMIDGIDLAIFHVPLTEGV